MKKDVKMNVDPEMEKSAVLITNEVAVRAVLLARKTGTVITSIAITTAMIIIIIIMIETIIVAVTRVARVGTSTRGRWGLARGFFTVRVHCSCFWHSLGNFL